MKLKHLIFGVFLIGLFILAGCTSSKTTNGPQGAYVACYGDEKKMITAAFDEFAPVSSETSPYQAGEEIETNVKLTNKFPEDIDTGKVKVRLTGDAAIESVFTGAKEVSADTLYGADIQTCLTEETDVDAGPIVYQGDISTKISKEITGLYCYEAPVVVKAYLYFTGSSEEIGENLPKGSNPPSSVQVTKIEQNPVDVDRATGDGTMRFKIYVQNVDEGTIVPSLDDCFKYREPGYREELSIKINAPYNVECPESIKLSREEKTDVVTCKITGIDTTNMGPQASEMTITLQGFAYEDQIPPTTIWLEP